MGYTGGLGEKERWEIGERRKIGEREREILLRAELCMLLQTNKTIQNSEAALQLVVCLSVYNALLKEKIYS